MNTEQKQKAFTAIREFVTASAPASQDGFDWREVEFSGFKFQIFGIGRRNGYVRLEYLDVPVANENPIYITFDADIVERALTIIDDLNRIKVIASRLPLAQGDEDGDALNCLAVVWLLLVSMLPMALRIRYLSFILI
jgi:hypothetical protein